MRFPDTPFMKRVYDLAENRNLPVKLIPYVMQMVEPTPNTFLFYNNSRVNNQDSSITGDPFNVSSYVTDSTLTTPQGVAQKVATVIQGFRDFFRPEQGKPPPNIKTVMEVLFELTNQYSMRSYMFSLPMDPRDINWCETLDKSTGWYDRALTESAYWTPLVDSGCNVGSSQLLSRAWPSIGPLRPFQAPSHRTQIQMGLGIASSTLWLL